MAVNVPIAGAALARGLRNEFRNTWKTKAQDLEARMGAFFRSGIPSDSYASLFGYWEPPLYPTRRPWGEGVESKPFKARNFEVINYAWSSKVEWYKHQRQFDQLGDLTSMAQRAGSNFASLNERVAIQIITGATDAELLPTAPNAPDGVALYSATDSGGGARFGVTGGNIVTGSGILTPDAILTDLYAGTARMVEFQDPNGQPANDPSLLDGPLTILYGVANNQVFRQAFVQTFQQIGANTAQSNAAVSNLILDSGQAIRLVPTQRITDNDWFIFADGTEVKPLFSQVAQPLEEHYADESNSDQARNLKVEGLYFESIMGFGVNLPLGAVMVNN
jgi:hypothetical protein